MDPIILILAALAVIVWIIISNISVVQQSRA